MRVLICGDRDWSDVEAIRNRLVELPPGSTVIHGAARGADSIAGRLAESMGFEVIAASVWAFGRADPQPEDA